MRKADIIDEIVSSRLKEAYEFFVNLEKLKRGLTISQALKVATGVLGVPPSELVNVKSKKDLLVLLYGKFGINQISSKIDVMLDYANKLKSGRVVRHIRVVTRDLSALMILFLALRSIKRSIIGIVSSESHS